MMSFILKTVEKLLSWEFNDTALRQNPLHKRQFGFRAGRGTDEAISTATDVIELALNRGQHTIAVDLDISGAFNNVCTDTIVSSFRSRGFNPKLVDW